MTSSKIKYPKIIKRLLVLLIFIILLEAGLIYLSKNYAKNDQNRFNVAAELRSLKSPGLSTYDAIRQQLKYLVERGGIEGVIKLAEFALQQKEISMDQCHNLLHLIGHEAYEYFKGDVPKLILYGSAICIASFQHGIEAQIAEADKSPTENLKRYCEALRKSYPGISCYHGAGHGYMRILKDPHQAVKKCDELEGGPDNELWNCYRGVFSEYGNQALGVDSDTGQPLPDGPQVSLERESPLLFCDQFDKKYRDSCYSQITKVHYSSNVDESLKSCLKEKYSSRMQEICINIISGVDSRNLLSHQDHYQVSNLVFSLPANLRKAYILGVRETMIGFKISGIKKEWEKFCEEFKLVDDQRFCIDNLQSL